MAADGSVHSIPRPLWPGFAPDAPGLALDGRLSPSPSVQVLPALALWGRPAAAAMPPLNGCVPQLRLCLLYLPCHAGRLFALLSCHFNLQTRTRSPSLRCTAFHPRRFMYSRSALAASGSRQRLSFGASASHPGEMRLRGCRGFGITVIDTHTRTAIVRSQRKKAAPLIRSAACAGAAGLSGSCCRLLPSHPICSCSRGGPQSGLPRPPA